MCSCPLGMELGADNKTCQIQSYCAKHLKCSQKCEQDKYNVKCSCYEGWMLEPDGESCRSLGVFWGAPGTGSSPPAASGCLSSRGAGGCADGHGWVMVGSVLTIAGAGCTVPCLVPDPALLPPDPFKPFIIFSNRHEIRRIDLHRGDYSVLVPGLRNTIALDFHLNQSSLYWTDVVEDKIYRGKLLENGGAEPWVGGAGAWRESRGAGLGSVILWHPTVMRQLKPTALTVILILFCSHYAAVN